MYTLLATFFYFQWSYSTNSQFCSVNFVKITCKQILRRDIPNFCVDTIGSHEAQNAWYTDENLWRWRFSRFLSHKYLFTMMMTLLTEHRARRHRSIPKTTFLVEYRAEKPPSIPTRTFLPDCGAQEQGYYRLWIFARIVKQRHIVQLADITNCTLPTAVCSLPNFPLQLSFRCPHVKPV